VLARRRHAERVDIEREFGDRLRFAATHGQSPHLARAAARREEQDVMAVRRPRRAGVVCFVRRQAYRVSTPDVAEPQVVAALVRVDIGMTDGIDDLVARRRDDRRTDAVDTDQVFGGERFGCSDR
jgi:hypothetical protein